VQVNHSLRPHANLVIFFTSVIATISGGRCDGLMPLLAALILIVN